MRGSEKKYAKLNKWVCIRHFHYLVVRHVFACENSIQFSTTNESKQNQTTNKQLTIVRVSHFTRKLIQK